MSCTIADYLLALGPDGSLQGVPKGLVYAVPSTVPLFVKNSQGILQELQNPQPTAVSDRTGLWSLTLPWPSQCSPGTVTWQIVLPDGTIWSGTVPEGITGPLTMQTLKQAPYNWALVAGSATATVTTSTGPAGPPGMNWRGTWNGGTAYQLNDAVAYNGSSYICLAANTNQNPATSPIYWQVIALAGSTTPVSSYGTTVPVSTQEVFPGFDGSTDTISTTFNANGTVTITYAKSGVTETMTFNKDGSITETFTGGLTKTKTTTFTGNTITEAVA